MIRARIITSILFCLICSSSVASIIHIPGEYSTIQAGIDNSYAGDTILISPGSYQEHLTIGDHPVALASEFLITRDTFLISNTSIDANLSGIAIAVYHSGQDASSIIGLTITNGLGEFGGGIAVSGCGCKISDNIIHDNQAQVYGSAIYAYNSTDVEISRNTIYSNSGNVGAVFVHNSTFSFDHNLVFGNLSAIALEFFQINHGIVINNTFTDNQCGDYGQITVNGEAEISIENNIVTSSARYGIFFFDFFNIPCMYNDVWDNQSGGYFRATPGTGSISDNPVFAENYSLDITSPCIDAGDPATPADPDGTRPDMGARYYDQGSRIYQFHLLEPLDHEIINSPLQALTWNSTRSVDSSRVIAYNVFWDTDRNFNSPESSSVLTDTSFICQDCFDRSIWYFWRVRASDNFSDPLYSNETRSFYLDGIPSVPEIISPDDGTMADPTTVLAWFLSTDPDSFDIVTYSLQVDNDSNFTSPALIQFGIAPELISDDAMGVRINQLDDYANLVPNQRYFWRLRADDAYGISSDWTSGGNWFYYLWQHHAPEPFSLVSPEYDEHLVNATIRFMWNRADDIDPDSHISYSFECSIDSIFQDLLFESSGILDTSIVIPTDSLALSGQLLYWRILAIDNYNLIRIGGIPEGPRRINIAAPGDANNSGYLGGLDLIFLKNYIYDSGPAPLPLLSGDQNGDCEINSLDITYMNLYFRGFGPRPERPVCQ